MSNELYKVLAQNPANLGNNMQQLISRFNQFKNTFKGNPQEQVQQLLNSGKVTQEQYNQAVRIAQSLQSMLK